MFLDRLTSPNTFRTAEAEVVPTGSIVRVDSEA